MCRRIFVEHTIPLEAAGTYDLTLPCRTARRRFGAPGDDLFRLRNLV